MNTVHNAFAIQIIELKNADLKLRDELIAKGELSKGYNKAMQSLHDHNADALNSIIDKIGFPTVDKVGEEASEAAWLVAQHSIGRPAFMKKYAKLFEAAVGAGEASPNYLAYLTDRIAVHEGKTQLYGTQFDWNDNGELSPRPVDDPEKVNQRRRSLGMNTLQEQTAVIDAQAKIEGQSPPADREARSREIEQWRKEVGWIK